MHKVAFHTPAINAGAKYSFTAEIGGASYRLPGSDANKVGKTLGVMYRLPLIGNKYVNLGVHGGLQLNFVSRNGAANSNQNQFDRQTVNVNEKYFLIELLGFGLEFKPLPILSIEPKLRAGYGYYTQRSIFHLPLTPSTPFETRQSSKHGLVYTWGMSAFLRLSDNIALRFLPINDEELGLHLDFSQMNGFDSFKLGPTNRVTVGLTLLWN